MKSIFSPDNIVVRFFIKLSYIWILNILWLVTSIPIFTIGASTTALIYSSMKLHKDDGYVWKNYFQSFKENFGQATAIWMIYLGVGALLAVDMIYWAMNGYHTASGGINVLWAISIALVVLYAISFEWVFAIQSKFVNTVSNTIRYSFVLPFKHLKETVLMLVLTAVVIYVNVSSVVGVNYFTINLGIGVVAYIFAVYYINVFKNYIPEDREATEVETQGYVTGSIDDPAAVGTQFDEALNAAKEEAFEELEKGLKEL